MALACCVGCLPFFLKDEPHNNENEALIITDSISQQQQYLPSSSSSTPNPRPGYEFEVFLSFRGPDTRKGFTDFLYNSLKGAGVCVFRDDESLRKGEEIGPELLEAINQSKISIPIFSKGYAASKWCLKELAQMVECRRRTKQKVLPIFYDVSPHDVRHQSSKSYSEALSQHVKRYEQNTVQQWKEALAEVGALKGWDAMNGYQGELIKSVVSRVLRELKKAHRPIPENLIAIEDREEEVMRLLEIGVNDVRIVGLWGMGGIGKTTLAKFVYNQILDNFECCSFLDDIRQRSKDEHMKSLQSTLFADLSKGNAPNFSSIYDGINELICRFRDKKVLIVLDDVDDVKQLEALIVRLDSYGPGSRVIVTTRNSDVLQASFKTKRIYEVKELNKDPAYQLFCQHAFGNTPPSIEFSAISKDVAETTGGLPLALKVIGSLLSGEDKARWVGTLKKLKTIPHKEVQAKLMISYDALDHSQKQIFLDIACLFIGRPWEMKVLCYMWEDCEFLPEDSIAILERMSLVKIEYGSWLWMHDQLRDLGREIVRQDSFTDLGKQSRLWDREKTRCLLEELKGSTNVEAARVGYYSMPEEMPRFSHQHFAILQNLRFLELRFVRIFGDFQDLLSNLRWFHCRHSFINDITSLLMKNLVILELTRTDIEYDWKGWSSIKMMKLKVLHLRSNQKLTRTPNFCSFPKLEKLTFHECHRLSVVDPSMWKLQHLKSLDISLCRNITFMDTTDQAAMLPAMKVLYILDCQAIQTLPDLSNLKQLEKLDVRYCQNLQVLEGVDKLEHLQELNIPRCRSMKMLPNLSYLKSLKSLDVNQCEEIQALEGLDKLEDLIEINISSCNALEKLPNLSRLKLLKKLDARNCKNLRVLEGLDQLEALEELNISKCIALEASANVSKLKLLKRLDASNCEKLQALEGIENLETLEELKIWGCESIKTLPNLSNLKVLKKLDTTKCVNLQLLEGLDELNALEELDISGCESIEKLPNLSNLKLLKNFTAYDCTKLQQLEGIDELVALTRLCISGCHAIVKLASLSKLKSLDYLEVTHCKKLEELPGLNRLETLEELHVSGCKSIKKLSNLSSLKLLKSLHTSRCKKLQHLDGLDGLESLVQLDISNCKAIQEFPNLSNLKFLKQLDISRCEKLKVLEGLGELEALEELDISRCKSIEKLPNLSRLKLLTKLNVRDCENLQVLEGLDKLSSLKELNITGCSGIEIACEVQLNILEEAGCNVVRKLDISD